MIELLKPNRNFPYSVNLLKCLINISKSNINNIFFNDCLFELLYHNNRNFDLTIINDLKFVLNSSNHHQNVNNNKKISKKYYVQHFIDFSDHSSVGSLFLSLGRDFINFIFKLNRELMCQRLKNGQVIHFHSIVGLDYAMILNILRKSVDNFTRFILIQNKDLKRFLTPI